MRTFIPLASLLLLASVGHAQSGWIYNPATKHWYQLAPASSWQDAENYAQSLNGHLVSIEDMHEDRWLYNNFGVLGAFWTGFNDIAHESRWVWSSGDFITHTNWAPNQPDNTTNEDACVMLGPNAPYPSEWADLDIDTHFPGVVEINFHPDHLLDADGDGISNWDEVNLWGTDPRDQDSDDDGLSDGQELMSPHPSWINNPINNNWYRLSRPGTWEQAQAEAISVGGQLVTIRSQAENNWLMIYMYQPSCDLHSELNGPWIGLHDHRIENSFEWISGEALSFTNWRPGEPNAFGGDEDFVHLTAVGEWNDLGHSILCGDRLPGIIELLNTPPVLGTDPLNADSDGDQILDGTEVGITTGWPGDPANGIGGTDLSIFVPDADPDTLTNPLDFDSDDDGYGDGSEDVNFNGRADSGELDASRVDSDGDGIQDGTENGLVQPSMGTDLSVFVPDNDPSTRTNPLDVDSDGGGLHDGMEDLDRNGLLDPLETDPLDHADDRFLLEMDPPITLTPGDFATFEVFGARAFAGAAILYSLTGSGPTQTDFGLTMDLSVPIVPYIAIYASGLGYASHTFVVPLGAPSGLSVYFQAIEFEFWEVRRLSNPLTRLIM